MLRISEAVLYGDKVRCMIACAVAAAAALGQTPDNKSLNGKYFFREVLIASDNSEVRSISGTLTFNGSGTFTFTGQQIVGNSASATADGSGAYTVKSSGIATISDPLRSGVTLNARVGSGALIGSTTEAGTTLFDLLIAFPAPSAAVTASTLTGPYQASSFEVLNGSLAQVRQAYFKLTANGSGSFNDISVLGEAQNLGSRATTQTVAGSTYTLSADGSGTVVFPLPGGSDGTGQLLGGSKVLYISQDGSLFLAGGTNAGGHGLIVGVRTGTSSTNSALTGLYWSGGIRADSGSYSAYAGSANSVGDGRIVFARRLRDSTFPAAIDVTALNNATIASDGSGSTKEGNRIALSSNGQFFLGSGMSPLGDTTNYELFFGVRAPSVSGTGAFLNPQGVFNVFGYAPAGTPICPGEFITIYGTGLPVRNGSPIPFPTVSNGAQLLINNTAAPIYLSTATQIFAVVPYGISGPIASIVLSVNGAKSNTVEVPLALSSPGVASVAQNGLGPGAITHADGSLVTSSSPAKKGETIVVYLTGLGAVNPTVADGTGAPSNPLSLVPAIVGVYIGGIQGKLQYQGLTPGLVGLYQLNVVVPNEGPTGTLPLAVQTTESFTDMVDIAVAPTG